MNKSTLRKIIVGIITIFGFLFFYVGVGTIKHANANQYISMSRAFEVVKESTLYIIGSFFLLYPLFSKVSKNRKINFSRSLVAIVFLIYSVFKFIGTLVLAGDVGMNYYGVSLGEVLKHDLFFYSYLRIYLSYLVFWILVIHPFIVKKNGKIKLEYSRTELKNQSAIFNKLDSLLDSTAVYLSKKINVFLDKGNTSKDPIRT